MFGLFFNLNMKIIKPNATRFILINKVEFEPKFKIQVLKPAL